MGDENSTYNKQHPYATVTSALHRAYLTVTIFALAKTKAKIAQLQQTDALGVIYSKYLRGTHCLHSRFINVIFKGIT